MHGMDPVAKSRILRRFSADEREVAKLLQRAEVQLEFAAALVAAAPADFASDATSRTDREAHKLDNVSGSLEELRLAIGAMEASLADIGQAAKKYTIHCVGHGHIDMNWMWSWPETVSMTHDTFASVLNLMDQYPDFIYSQSQASVYAAIEKHHPQMFEAIQQRVKEGRWEVTAAHWVEGDKNLASGESLCRHLLYTRDYFADRFDLKPEVRSRALPPE